MSDNTANWHTCPDCGILIDGRIAHACPGSPWQTVTLSPGMVFDAEIKDYLRRIAEALEALTSIRAPQDWTDRYRQLAAIRTMIDAHIIEALGNIEDEETP